MSSPDRVRTPSSVRLDLLRQGPWVLVGASARHDVYSARLLGYFRVEGAAAVWPWLIDTGCPISVFPSFVWTEFWNQIEWLNGDRLPDSLTAIHGLAGGAIASRLGCVRVFLCDLDGRSVGPVPIVAKFEDKDSHELHESLFGLGGGTLTGRKLHVEYDAGEAWLRQL